MALFFFFQAEDGIRDLTVTGVQTCALPIFDRVSSAYQESTVYSCSMHPEVQSSKPGKCPKCGMKLVAQRPSEQQKPDRKSTRLNSSHSQNLVCRLLLEKNKAVPGVHVAQRP